jgi:hypothetical protein
MACRSGRPVITEAPSMWQVFKEFLLFLRQEKKWWLIPFVVILLLLGMFLVFAPTSPLAPFIYSLF